MVVFGHLVYQHYLQWNFIGIKWLIPFELFLKDSQLGVNIFFVISGFLITSLMLQEELNTNTVSLKNFYIRRFLRIFPAYYFLLLVYFILSRTGYIYISTPSWITSITYTKYIFQEQYYDWYTGHFWSLSMEELFYLFWPFIFSFGNRIRKIVVISIVLLVPFLRLYAYYNPIEFTIFELSPLSRFDSIAIGCICALYIEELLKIFKPYLALLFCISFFGLIAFPYIIILAIRHNVEFIFIPLGRTHGSIANLFIAFILLYSVFGRQGLWFKFLNTRVMNYIGLLSYSLYLWQQLFLYKNSWYFINQYPWNLVYIIIASMFSYYIIEKPFLRLKTKF